MRVYLNRTPDSTFNVEVLPLTGIGIFLSQHNLSTILLRPAGIGLGGWSNLVVLDEAAH